MQAAKAESTCSSSLSRSLPERGRRENPGNVLWPVRLACLEQIHPIASRRHAQTLVLFTSLDAESTSFVVDGDETAE